MTDETRLAQIRAEVCLNELTEEERLALPAQYHRPHWDGLGEPQSWICTACWGDGWTSEWPCKTATEGGLALARATGMEYSW